MAEPKRNETNPEQNASAEVGALSALLPSPGHPPAEDAEGALVIGNSMRNSSLQSARAVLFAALGLGGVTGCGAILGLDSFTEGTGGQGGSGSGGSIGTMSSGAGGALCTPGAVEACYDGPAATRGVGTCKDGKRTCKDDASGWGACADEVVPAAEVCSTTADENCDGLACGGTEWAQRFGDGVNQYGRAVTVDGSGNIYILGALYGAMAVGKTNLISQGNEDVFLAKLDPAGTPLWAKSFGSANNQTAYALASDSAGNVAATGISDNAIDLGCGKSQPAGAWVAKWDSTGKCIWSSGCAVTANSSAAGGGIAIDSLGDVIVVGTYVGTMDCGSGAKTADGGSSNMFITKIASSGTTAWTRVFGDKGAKGAQGVAVDTSNNVMVTGDLMGGKVNFGGDDHLDDGKGSGFLLRLNAAGGFVWSHAWPNSRGTAVAVDALGGTTIAGALTGPANFGGGTLNPTAAGSSDVFVARFGAGGNHVFSKRFGVASSYSVAVDKDTNIVLIGDFYAGSSVAFGDNFLTNAGGSDAFIAKLDPMGNHLWSSSQGGPGADYGRGVAVGPTGEIVMVGDFVGTSALGAFPLVSAGLADVFIAKLVP